MSPFSRILIPSILMAYSIGATALAQTVPIPTANPCAADPDSPQADKSLSDQLDDCNGVLVPPKVGDSEIVEPAPEGGTIRVIPPGALPDQQGDATPSEAMPEPKQTTDGDYDLSKIVGAIANSGSAAEVLMSIEPSRVDVRDISILVRGSNAAILNASLEEHAADVNALRTSIRQRAELTAAVTGKGLAVAGIVGAMIGNDQSVTLFGR